MRGHRDLPQITIDVLIEGEIAAVDELQCGDAGEELGHRGDRPYRALDVDRYATFLVGHPVALRIDDLVLVYEDKRSPGDSFFGQRTPDDGIYRIRDRFRRGRGLWCRRGGVGV